MQRLRRSRRHPPALRRRSAFVTALALSVPLGHTALGQVEPDAPIECEACEGWNAPLEPFKIFGDTYYVGTAGLAAILIATSDGLILLDGGLPQTAPAIDAAIRALGFRTEDLRLVLNTHAHYDHAGGIAALQRASGAAVAASAWGAAALERGGPLPDDPQYALGAEVNAFPPVVNVRTVRDGEALRVGGVAVTAHLTPGHTPGSTTWSWRSCERDRCLDFVYADSLNPVSADGFRFSGDDDTPSVADTFRRSIETVAALPCDVLLSPHPGFVDLEGKLDRRRAGTVPDPFIDPDACRKYAAAFMGALDRRLEAERRATAR